MPGKSANLTLAVAVLMQPGVGRSSRTDFDSSCSQQGCACWHPFPRIRDYWLDLSVPVFFFANQKQRRSLWICTFVIFRFQKIAIKRCFFKKSYRRSSVVVFLTVCVEKASRFNFLVETCERWLWHHHACTQRTGRPRPSSAASAASNLGRRVPLRYFL